MQNDFKFSTSFRVRIGDINYGGHMGNEKYLLLFHDARIRFLELLGFSEKNIGDTLSLIMSEAHVNYKAEVFLGDELSVGVKVSDMDKIRFKMEYQVERKSDGLLVATGYTQMVAFDYQHRKIRKIPAAFRNLLKS